MLLKKRRQGQEEAKRGPREAERAKIPPKWTQKEPKKPPEWAKMGPREARKEAK